MAQISVRQGRRSIVVHSKCIANTSISFFLFFFKDWPDIYLRHCPHVRVHGEKPLRANQVIDQIYNREETHSLLCLPKSQD